ncbi:MAG: family 16 glycoside hydrolase, partial [Chthoniobacteraceae bacterium]
MGAVYKARQTSLNRVVALKLLPAHFAGDPDFLARFKHEAMAAASLNHPNIVQVFAAGEDAGTHFFAMEYVEGESLGSRLERKGRIDPHEAIAVACHLAQALDYAWRKAQVIHRDIKPDNIFLSREGTVKLGDLGLAKVLGNQSGLTQTGAAMGTPYYVSPEQAMGVKAIDFRADIYSLGCTIYHAMTGLPPYQGESAMSVMLQHVSQPAPKIQSVWPECPPPLIGLLDRMLRKRPEERHESYEALLRQLYWVAERLDQPSQTAAAAMTMVVPMPLPRSGSTPDATRPTPVQAARSAAPVPPPAKGGAGKIIAVLALLAATAGGLFVWQPWKKPAPPAVVAAVKPETPAAPASSPIPAEATNVSPTTATKAAPFVNSLGMRFVPVPGTNVLMCIHETRRQDYAAYATAESGVDGRWQNMKRNGEPVGYGEDHPVVGVNWSDGVEFCEWLSRKEGVKYRLPSDKEWSYAVGIGREEARYPEASPQELHNKRIKNKFPWGYDWPPPDGADNLADTSLKEKHIATNNGSIKGYTDGFPTTAPVMSFRPNELGIYDLGGNVQEWCEDWMDASQKMRSARGGTWDNCEQPWVESSYRCFVGYPKDRTDYRGFRCVLDLVEPAKTATPGTAAVETLPSAAPAPTPTPDTDGFVSLLDSEHAGGWKQAGPGGFRLQDGVATSWMTSEIKGGRWWYLSKTYADFTLKLEFRIETPGGNSGVYVRGTNRADHEPCYQIDVSEDANPLERTGAICLIKAPISEPQKPREWNDLEITAVGQHYLVKVNGTLVNDFTGNLRTSGYIGLQNCKVGGVQYRNVRIRELPPGGSTPASATAISPPVPVTPPPKESAIAKQLRATKDEPFANSLGMKFVPVPGTEVLVSIWETRVRDYAAFARAKKVSDGWTKQEKSGVPISRGPDDPVVAVPWEDAVAFCDWLTEREVAAKMIVRGMRYRLPSDPEWSSAVGIPTETGSSPKERQKTNVVFTWGNAWPPPNDKLANLRDLASQKQFSDGSINGYNDGFAVTSPVGSFPANQFGIFDLSGNVSEWCQDVFEPGGNIHFRRGSSFHSINLSWNGLTARHTDDTLLTGPTEPPYTAGFRCVLALDATAPARPIQNPQPAQAALPIGVPTGMARALFNGRDLTGWHISSQSRNRRNAWKAENGELKNDVLAGESGANLETDEKFWNFNLHYEYKVARDSRSAISLRSIHWLKIHGDFIGGQLSEASDGTIGGRKAPDVYASDRSGGWNTADVTMDEQTLSVTLNGKKIHDAVDVSALPRGIAAEAWAPGRAGPVTL